MPARSSRPGGARLVRPLRVVVRGRRARRTLAQPARRSPARTAESDALSKDLKRRGFRFVGSTICYAFMQAVGMVNDHLVSCFRYEEVG